MRGQRFGNGVRPLCCGREPMLRVKERVRGATVINDLQYGCRVCGRKAREGDNERDARQLWSQRRWVA